MAAPESLGDLVPVHVLGGIATASRRARDLEAVVRIEEEDRPWFRCFPQAAEEREARRCVVLEEPAVVARAWQEPRLLDRRDSPLVRGHDRAEDGKHLAVELTEDRRLLEITELSAVSALVVLGQHPADRERKALAEDGTQNGVVHEVVVVANVLVLHGPSIPALHPMEGQSR